jgi:hypothetical protein
LSLDGFFLSDHLTIVAGRVKSMLIAAKQIRAAGQVSSLNPTLATITNK